MKRLLTSLLVLALAAGLAAGIMFYLLPDRSAGDQPVLVMLVPHAGGCGLYTVQATDGESSEVTRFPSECEGGRMAFSPDLSRAVVWFRPAGRDAGDIQMFLVDMERGAFQRMPRPDPGDPELIAWDESGRLWVLTLNHNIEVEITDEAETLIFDGTSYTSLTGGEGQDALAHALQYDDGQYTVRETRASRCCDRTDPGVQVLVKWRDLLSRADLTTRESMTALTSTVAGYPLEVTVGQKQQPGLDLSQPPGSRWLRIPGAGWSHALIARATSDDPGALISGRMLIERGNIIAPLPGSPFGPNDLITVTRQGQWALVGRWSTGAEPHLYDMNSGQLVYSSPHAASAMLLPPVAGTPASPPD